MRIQFHRRRARQTGFTMIEILVAMAVGALLMAGVIQIYLGTKTSYRAQEGMSRLQENARYAMYLVERDLRMMNFLGCPQRKIRDINPLEESLPEDLRITYRNLLNTSAQTSFLWNATDNVRGFDGGGSDSAMTLLNSADGSEGVADTTDEIAGTDVLSLKVVRGLGGVFTAEWTDEDDLPISVPASTALVPGEQVVMVTDCQKTSIQKINYNTATGVVSRSSAGASAAGSSVGDHSIPADGGAGMSNFGIGAKIYPIDTVTYYLREDASGLPGLWRRVNDEALGADDDRLVVEGVENLQITYGLDSATNRSNRADRYITADAVVDTAIDLDSDPDWHRVVSIRVGMLLATPEQVETSPLSQTFTVNDESVTGPTDRRLRRVFNSTVTLRNVAS